MADRAKTYWQGNHVLGATPTTDGTGSGVIGSVKDGLQAPSWYTLSLGANPLPHWLAFDFGAGKDWDRVAIHISEPTVARAPKDLTVQGSDDGSSWSDIATVTNLFGASAPANANRWAVISITRQTSKRHLRLYFTGAYAGADYVATGEVFVWDSTLLGAELLADVGTVFRFYDAQSVSSQSAFTDKALTPTYGWYNTAHGGTLELDFGALKYVGGLDLRAYSSGNYTPDTLQVFTSPDGTRQSWVLVETLDLAALGVVGVNKMFAVPFTRIHRTRYLRIVADKQAGKSGSVLWWNGEIHETLTPAAPVAPTALIVTGDSDDDTSLQLRWSHAGASDDNLAADIDFEVQRSKDGGAYATVATVQTKYLVDSGLAAGSYTYKVRAVNRYHAEASAYTAASAAEVVPVAASGGGGGGVRPVFLGAGMR